MKTLKTCLVALGVLCLSDIAWSRPCQVIVDKVVKQTTQARNRDDCYKQIGFGSENCNIYGKKGYFPNPNHQYFLDQVFNGNDRVTSEYCPKTKTYSCQVIVDKVVKQTTQAKNRDDCYKQIGFGSENCNIYGKKGYFPNPNHQYFLDQVFNGNDRVTSEYCPKSIATPCKSGATISYSAVAGGGGSSCAVSSYWDALRKMLENGVAIGPNKNCQAATGWSGSIATKATRKGCVDAGGSAYYNFTMGCSCP